VQALVEAAPAAGRPTLVYVWDRAINGAPPPATPASTRARRDRRLLRRRRRAEPVVVERLLAHYARVPDLAVSRR